MILHKSYQDFEISWEEPPIFSGKWSANVATENLALYGAMVTYRGGAEGAAIIEGQDREEILANARKFIDAVRSDC